MRFLTWTWQFRHKFSTQLQTVEVSGFAHQLAVFLLLCSNDIITLALFFPSKEYKYCPYMSKQMFSCASIYENKYIYISQMGKWEKLNYFLGLSTKFVAELQRESDFFSLQPYSIFSGKSFGKLSEKCCHYMNGQKFPRNRLFMSLLHRGK